MKVVLIDPPGIQEGLNVGLAYLSGSLKHDGHEVKVFDLNNNSIKKDAWLDEVEEFNPRIVGISVKSSTFFNASEIADAVKSRMPDVLIVGGGPHPTIVGNSFTDKAPSFTFGIMGEGEDVFPRLVQAIAEGKPTSINGVFKAGRKKEVSPVFVRDLDKIAFPAYESFTNIRETMARVRYPVLTSRGCPYQCTYCSVSAISGHKWRTRSLENVVSEIVEARRRYRIKAFEIVDDNFTVDVARAKEFCRMLIERNVKLSWSCPNGIRMDRIDFELAVLMREAGCELVMVGVESADEEVFKGIQKGESLTDIEEGIRTLQKAGIQVGGYFIIGLPGDSVNSTKKSVEFAKKTGLNPAHFNMLVPYPGTPLWDWVLENGRMLADYKEGRHFIGKPEPVFETDDFPAKDRVKAYYMANTLLKQWEYV
ncbi:MAG: radical SAM protein, partial [Methanobacteriota archaeon]